MADAADAPPPAVATASAGAPEEQPSAAAGEQQGAAPACRVAGTAGAAAGHEGQGAAEEGGEGLSRTASKRQKRRLEAAERRKEAKKARRAADKEAQRAKVAARRAERQAALEALPEAERAEAAAAGRARAKEERRRASEAKNATAARLEAAKEVGVKLAIDMRWADDQTEREMRSLCFQLGQCYASNRTCPDPCCLYLAGLSEESHSAMRRVTSGVDGWRGAVFDRRPLLEAFGDEKERVVYLSADAEEELGEMDRDTVYVVGGMLDHNSKKGSTQRAAQDEGWRSARLPLDKYVQLAGSKVLTVNQVVDMLLLAWAGNHHGLGWDDCWRHAVELAVPQRKRKGYVKGDGKAPGEGGACQAAYATIERAAKEKLGGGGGDGETGSRDDEGAAPTAGNAVDAADAAGDGEADVA